MLWTYIDFFHNSETFSLNSFDRFILSRPPPISMAGMNPIPGKPTSVWNPRAEVIRLPNRQPNRCYGSLSVLRPAIIVVILVTFRVLKLGVRKGLENGIYVRNRRNSIQE